MRRSTSYDLALVVAAVASFGLTQLAIRAINNAGGYYLHAIPAKSQISQWSTVPAQMRAFGQNLMYLFGANFWDRPQPQAAFGYLHLVGVAVALLGLLIAALELAEGEPGDASIVIAVFGVFAAGSVSPLMAPVSGAHEIAIMLPLGAVLRGRGIGPWLASRRLAEDQPAERPTSDDQAADDQTSDGQPADGRTASAQARPGRFAAWAARAALAALAARVAAACVLVAAGVGYLSDLGYNAAQPSNPAVDQDLAGWLVAHNLTSGLAGYWDASITMLGSGGKVPDRAAGRRRLAYGYLWESKAAWFDQDVYLGELHHHARSAAQGHGSPVHEPGPSTGTASPRRSYYFGNTVVLVYDHNLLQSVIQPTPADLYRPGSRLAPGPTASRGHRSGRIAARA